MGKTYRKEQRYDWKHKKTPVKFSHSQKRQMEQLRKLTEGRETTKVKESDDGLADYHFAG